MTVEPKNNNPVPVTPLSGFPSLEQVFGIDATAYEISAFLPPDEQEQLKIKGYFNARKTLVETIENNIALTQYGPDIQALKELKAKLGDQWPKTPQDVPKLKKSGKISDGIQEATPEDIIRHLGQYPHYHPHLMIDSLYLEEVTAFLKITDQEIIKICPLAEESVPTDHDTSAEEEKQENNASAAAAAMPAPKSPLSDSEQKHVARIRQRIIMAVTQKAWNSNHACNEILKLLTTDPSGSTLATILALDDTYFTDLFLVIVNARYGEKFLALEKSIQEKLQERALACNENHRKKLFSNIDSFSIKNMPIHIWIRYLAEVDVVPDSLYTPGSLRRDISQPDPLNWMRFVNEAVLRKIQGAIERQFPSPDKKVDDIIESAVIENIQTEGFFKDPKGCVNTLFKLLKKDKFADHRESFIHYLLRYKDDKFAQANEETMKGFTPQHADLLKGRYIACRNIPLENKIPASYFLRFVQRLPEILSCLLSIFILICIFLMSPPQLFGLLICFSALTGSISAFVALSAVDLDNKLTAPYRTLSYIILTAVTILTMSIAAPILAVAPLIAILVFIGYDIFKQIRQHAEETQRHDVNKRGAALLKVAGAVGIALAATAGAFMLFSMDKFIAFFMGAGFIGLGFFAIGTVLTMAVFALQIDQDLQTEKYATHYLQHKYPSRPPTDASPEAAAHAKPAEAGDNSDLEDEKQHLENSATEFEVYASSETSGDKGRKKENFSVCDSIRNFLFGNPKTVETLDALEEKEFLMRGTTITPPQKFQ